MTGRLPAEDFERPILDPETEGTTAVLTQEGWEAAEYIAPGDDWTIQRDGSYLSPDGTMRTWVKEA